MLAVYARGFIIDRLWRMLGRLVKGQEHVRGGPGGAAVVSWADSEGRSTEFLSLFRSEPVPLEVVFINADPQ